MSRSSNWIKALGLLVAMVALFVMFSFIGLIRLLFEGTSSSYPKDDREHIAVISIEGPIMGSEEVVDQIKMVNENSFCRGVILRVNSPGGSVGASQEIYSSLEALKKDGKPLIATFGNLAASGGYYVALAAETIFTNPGTITGSIGVIFQFPEAVELMDKLGIEVHTIASGELKDAASLFEKARPEELDYLKSVIENAYGQFFEAVRVSRNLDSTSLVQVADGRILTGAQALQAGLVDTIGSFMDTQNFILSITNLPSDTPFLYPKPKLHWLEELAESKASTDSRFFLRYLRERAATGLFYLWSGGI